MFSLAPPVQKSCRSRYNKTIKTHNLSWALAAAVPGVSAAKYPQTEPYSPSLCTVTVDSALQTDATVTLTATMDGVTGSVQVRVAVPRPSSIAVSGPAAIKAGQPSSLTYRAVILDQLGQQVHGTSTEDISWRIVPKNVAGVSVAERTGVVTVDSSVKAGSFVVAAEGGGMARLEGTQLVTVEAYDAVAFIATNDTAITLTAASNSLRIMSLKHRTAGWEVSTRPRANDVSGWAVFSHRRRCLAVDGAGR